MNPAAVQSQLLGLPNFNAEVESYVPYVDGTKC